MILSGESIEENKIISPFVYGPVSDGEGGTYGCDLAGYDIRCRLKEPCVLLHKGSFITCSTVERFSLPNNVVGFVTDRSTFARKGFHFFNTSIKPGWSGYLTLELIYFGDNEYMIMDGQSLAHVIFHQVDKETSGYFGKYQNQKQEEIYAK